MKTKYKHIFFDLDRTLYDFDLNSKATIEDIFTEFELQKSGIPLFEDFYKTYNSYNILLWEKYRHGSITKDKLSTNRFLYTLSDYGINNIALAEIIAHYYIENSPKKTCLFPGTIETLAYLKNKYKLHIITNGFEEIQFHKLNNSGLAPFFDQIITSEEAGVKKPDPYIFGIALEKAHAVVSESLMIGDDLEIDILGAKNIGMDQVYANYSKVPHNYNITFEVYNIYELQGII